jgi:hypothetical protein
MMLDVMACPLGSIDLPVERAAMIATIAETIRVYGKSDCRHGTIAPILIVRMRTRPISEANVQLCRLEPPSIAIEILRPALQSLQGVINRDPKSGVKSVSS